MLLLNTDTQTIPSFLDEGAVEELTALLDETHPKIVLAALQNVEDSDAAVFFVMCAHLKSDSGGGTLAAHAGTLFAQLSFEKRVSIAEKIATTEVVDAERATQIWYEHIAEIKETLEKTAFLGKGTTNLAKLLSYMAVHDQNQLLEVLAEKDPEMVSNISEQLFTFEGLSRLESESIKVILKVLDTQTLAVALHNAPSTVNDRFFENMSASQVEAIRAENDKLTFEQTQVADTARQSVVNLVRNFAAKGLLKLE